MEINGEVNIEIDQYADVTIDINTEDLAEILCRDHNFVDDNVLHTYVEEYCGDHIDDRVSEHVDALVGAIDGLRDQVSELEPDNNYVRINDLHTTIKEVVDARLIELFTRIIKEG